MHVQRGRYPPHHHLLSLRPIRDRQVEMIAPEIGVARALPQSEHEANTIDRVYRIRLKQVFVRPDVRGCRPRQLLSYQPLAKANQRGDKFPAKTLHDIVPVRVDSRDIERADRTE